MDVTEIIWRPDPATAARTRMGRFMTHHGLATLEDLQRRSIAEPEWYWDAVSRDRDAFSSWVDDVVHGRGPDPLRTGAEPLVGGVR